MGTKPSLALVFTLICCVLALPAHGSNRQAARILETTRIKGGLIVHIGCGEGTLTAALRAGDAYTVHGLDRDADNVAKAREYVQTRGLYGPVSVDRLDGHRLPYIDNLVNLVVLEEGNNISMDEVMRVLAPNGVVCVNRPRELPTTTKHWPAEMDEWTHYLHGPDGNPVADDSAVAPPTRL